MALGKALTKGAMKARALFMSNRKLADAVVNAAARGDKEFLERGAVWYKTGISNFVNEAYRVHTQGGKIFFNDKTLRQFLKDGGTGYPTQVENLMGLGRISKAYTGKEAKRALQLYEQPAYKNAPKKSYDFKKQVEDIIKKRFG